MLGGSSFQKSELRFQFSAAGSRKLLALAADSLQLLERPFVLLQLLARLAKLALGSEALILVKLLNSPIY